MINCTSSCPQIYKCKIASLVRIYLLLQKLKIRITENTLNINSLKGLVSIGRQHNNCNDNRIQSTNNRIQACKTYQ